MLVINSVEYDSYYDICKSYDIDYKNFIEYKKSHPDINELELLGNFIPNLAVRMDNGHYFIGKCY